ncbi:MAG: hypothetical protein HYS09_05465 [Chloroflexi bacterium]|nr:hypothetical protein [Chloroflexota bacterium]
MDGRLTEAEREEVEGHLPACDSCRRELDELRLTVEALRTLPQERAPRSFAVRPEDVTHPRPSPLAGAFPWSVRLGGAAVAVALAAVLVVDVGDFAGGGGGRQATAPKASEMFAADEALPEQVPAPTPTPKSAAPAAQPEASPLGAPDEAGGAAEPGEEATGDEATPSPALPAARAEDRTEAGPEEGAETAAAGEDEGGIDPLRAAEIALAAALGALALGSGAVVLVRRTGLR